MKKFENVLAYLASEEGKNRMTYIYILVWPNKDIKPLPQNCETLGQVEIPDLNVDQEFTYGSWHMGNNTKSPYIKDGQCSTKIRIKIIESSGSFYITLCFSELSVFTSTLEYAHRSTTVNIWGHRNQNVKYRKPYHAAAQVLTFLIHEL